MGAMEGKAIGQWFGPNTVAQVLKYVSNFFSSFSFWKINESYESLSLQWHGARII